MCTIHTIIIILRYYFQLLRPRDIGFSSSDSRENRIHRYRYIICTYSDRVDVIRNKSRLNVYKHTHNDAVVHLSLRSTRYSPDHGITYIIISRGTCTNRYCDRPSYRSLVLGIYLLLLDTKQLPVSNIVHTIVCVCVCII